MMLVYSPKYSSPSRSSRVVFLSASLSLSAALRIASPVKTDCLEAVLVPEFGVRLVSGASTMMSEDFRAQVSPSIWIQTVAIPWPMHAALVRICTLPFSTERMHLPVSATPTPSPLFLKAMASPARGEESYASLTASRHSMMPVSGCAI